MYRLSRSLSLSLVLFACCAMLLPAPAAAQQLDLPTVSPVASVHQRIGLTDIHIAYSRPSSKGRIIWGNLVPFGQLWRTGANNATTISINHDITIAGKNLSPGKYSLFTIPGQDEWVIILNRNTNLVGTAGYNQAEDVFRFTAKPSQAEFTETFTIEFSNLKENTATLDLRWDELVIHIPIQVDVLGLVEENITLAVSNAWRTYATAADWYVARDREISKALQLAEKSILLQDDTWNWFIKSRCLAKLNDLPAAISAAERSLTLAQQAKNDFYIQANQKNLSDWRNAVPGGNRKGR